MRDRRKRLINHRDDILLDMVKFPVTFVKSYLFCPRLPYLQHLRVSKPTPESERGRRLHQAYVALSVRSGRMVEEGVDFADAVEGLRGWVVDLLRGLGSPDPEGEAELVVSHRLRYGFEGLPVRGELWVEGDLLVGRVDVVEGCVPVEVKTGRPRRGDVAQALSYALLLSQCRVDRVVLDYLGYKRVFLRAGRRARSFVGRLVEQVLGVISDPWSAGAPPGAKCSRCPYRAECRLVFP